MSANTFVLNDYYRFVFSENLPLPQTAVPEPATNHAASWFRFA
jgi:hypothetical protein